MEMLWAYIKLIISVQPPGPSPRCHLHAATDKSTVTSTEYKVIDGLYYFLYK